MIYTVFTLSSPSDLSDVRFVGLTTQTVTKRVTDIVGMAKLPTASGNQSILSNWVRELIAKDQWPAATIVLDTYSKEEALKCRTATFDEYLPTGRLLNSFGGKLIGKKLRVEVPNTGKSPGREADAQSKSAKYALNRKQYARGEAELILRPNL